MLQDVWADKNTRAELETFTAPLFVLHIINLLDANIHTSALTPQSVLQSFCAGRDIHHVLHGRQHQLETL